MSTRLFRDDLGIHELQFVDRKMAEGKSCGSFRCIIYLYDIIEDIVLHMVIENNLSEEGKGGISYLFGIRIGSDIVYGDTV